MILSIISPVYGAKDIIAELVNQIRLAVIPLNLDYEIILIDDASPDNSWKIIEKLCAADHHIIGVRLSRNFGQHNAIAAGLELSKGDYVVVMDCDLQHNPKDIPRLLEAVKSGYDIVYTRTKTRQHGFVKNLTAKLYYWLLSHLSNFNMDPNIGTYSLLSRKVVNAYNQYNDYKKAYLWVLKWIGFDSTVIEVNYSERFSGESNYSPVKLVKHAIQVTAANSDRLLYISIVLGMIFSLTSVIGIMSIIIRYFSTGGLEGWSSTIIVIMFFSGLILISLGIIGIYLAKVFEQTKGRPRYLISKVLNPPGV